jgi:DNA-binding GntR family transcriptional regulator
MDQPVMELLETVDARVAPPPRGATVEHIAAKVREDLMSRRLAPGAHLVENELTSRFMVSRGPVREALRRLSAEGLVEIFPHRGAWVRRMNRETLREQFQIRAELEALSARLAAANREPARLSRFELAARAIHAEHARGEHEHQGEDLMFHDAVLSLGGSAQLRDIIHRLSAPTMTTGRMVSALDAIDQAVREHRSIAAAILAGDGDAASAAMRAHVERMSALALGPE